MSTAEVNPADKAQLPHWHARSSSPRIFRFESYQHYQDAQNAANARKLHCVWADDNVLNEIVSRVPPPPSPRGFALCHGSRNGYEQDFLASHLGPLFCVLGTDIAESASTFPATIQWDFHEENSDWVNSCDFVYSNSLDHSYDPEKALRTWIRQLKPAGALFVELPVESLGLDEVDCFAIDGHSFNELLSLWFGNAISIRVTEHEKRQPDPHINTYRTGQRVLLYEVRQFPPGL